MLSSLLVFKSSFVFAVAAAAAAAPDFVAAAAVATAAAAAAAVSFACFLFQQLDGRVQLREAHSL